MIHGSHKLFLSIIISVFSFFYTLNAYADPIQGLAVNLQILDKITAKIKTVEIYVNDTHEHGSLKIEIYTCYKRPPEEIPEDFVLLKIFDTIKKNDPEIVFQGWMISSSPVATPFEHPIYDVWVKECKIDKDS